jgi:hypothetical protein
MSPVVSAVEAALPLTSAARETSLKNRRGDSRHRQSAVARSLKCSNEGKYGEFVKNFSTSLALAMNQVVVGHQFANSELARNLSDNCRPSRHHPPGRARDGSLPAAQHQEAGEWLGRLVLGYEHGQVRIFGASIF